MARNAVAAALMAALMILGSLTLPTDSAMANPVECDRDSMTGLCRITVDAPGSEGASGGDGGKPAQEGGSASCTYKGEDIPCSANGGSWNSKHQCYASLPDDATPYNNSDEYLWVCISPEGGASAFVAPLNEATVIPPPDPRELAQQAISQMGLRHIGVGMAPPPGAGNVGVIGLPTWMWVADPGPQTTGPQTQSASLRGFTVTATATLADITWSMGDGTTVVCHGAGTPYDPSYGARPSPDCGHTYTKSGDYTVTATSHWTVAWEGIGENGVIPLTFTTSTTVTEAELQAIGQQ